MKLSLCFLMVLLNFCIPAAQASKSDRITSKLIDELNHAIEQRDIYKDAKEKHLTALKQRLGKTTSLEQRYLLLDSLYTEYRSYRFDSAWGYASKQSMVAQQLGDPVKIAQATIHRGLLLTATSLFAQSERELLSVDTSVLKGSLLAEYYYAQLWLNATWSEYMGDNDFAEERRNKEAVYRDSLIAVCPNGSAAQYYWRGIRSLDLRQYETALSHFNSAVKMTPENSRLHAMANYGVAKIYFEILSGPEYERWLIQSAIADIKSCTTENLALQQLAFYIYDEDNSRAEEANNYLLVAMEDAVFYNSRLRMLQIAHKLPSVVNGYQDALLRETLRLKWMVGVAGFILFVLIVVLFYVKKRNDMLKQSRANLDAANQDLKVLYAQKEQHNSELKRLNVTRERYVSLFMDLCAAYIEKHNRFQNLVKRKVKAKQADDLLKLASQDRLSDTDTREFFLNFDTAFLALYPQFVQQFNLLLRPEEQVQLRKGELLNTELRIFALVRLGITDSAKISTLLFYSAQTIYNYRSMVKKRALNPETFEQDVSRLCTFGSDNY